MLLPGSMRFSLSALAVASVVLVVLPAATQAADTPAERPAQAPRVTVMPVTRAELVEKLGVTGTLVARDEVLVGAEIDGLQIIELLAEEGQQVASGQVLARLRRDTLEAQLAQNDAALARAGAGIQQAKSQITQAESALKQAEQALERTSALRKTGFAAQAVFDQQTNEERTARAKLQAAQDGLLLSEADRASMAAQRRELLIRLARTEVKAPVDGLISRRHARLGGVAAMAGEPLFRLIARGEIELEAEVPASRIGIIREGVPATVISHDVSQRGQVRLVSPEVDKLTRLGRIRIALGAQAGLKIGSFARGIVETRRARGLSVPLSAVLYGESGPFVQVVTEGRIVTSPVKTGILDGQMVEVITGVSEGQKVVLKAGAFLRGGDAVTPAEAGAH